MENKLTITVAVIEGIVFLLPLLKVVWSLSHANDTIKNHELRLEKVENKQEKYQEKLGDMLDEIKACLNKISNTLDILDMRVKTLEEKEKNK